MEKFKLNPDTILIPEVQHYIDLVVKKLSERQALVSIIVFGSATTGGYKSGVSDIDLLVIVAENTSRQQKKEIQEEELLLEIAYGLKKNSSSVKGAVASFIEKKGGNDLSCFVCTEKELLTGNLSAIFNLNRAEALFIDRIVFANIVSSAVTGTGKDLLPGIAIPPILSTDLVKAFFGFFSFQLLTLLLYPFLPDATKYAMGTLKRALHCSYFYCHSQSAALEKEIHFFHSQMQTPAFIDLQKLRDNYTPSIAFVFHSFLLLPRLFLFAFRFCKPLKK
jgi:predicted nucleotidyltransferase